MTTDLKIFILLYIVSFVFNYFTLREYYLKKPSSIKPDYFDVISVITPAFNLFYSIIMIIVEIIINENIKVY